MPLIIPRGAYGRWLDSGADVSDLLRPNETTLVGIPVSMHVNSAANDDRKCIEPIDLGAQSTLL